ncbi:O-antigen ligase family protein [Protaetiibacter intestinalis]|uniref:O-antigen ligase family protein n=1 Tax=Protaetiibacter intestinalis TaxID=2419774 RepID=UPI001300B376|nr:O-antigen ligase family protein [Protaetiibacter intestinalis]
MTLPVDVVAPRQTPPVPPGAVRRVVSGPTVALVALLAVILFVPIRTYAIPVPLPFQLEPYRLLIAVLLIGAFFVLLAHPRMRLRPVAFGVPIAVFLGTLVLSIVVSIVPLAQQGLVGTAFGGLVNLMFILSVFFLVRQFLSSERVVMATLGFLAYGGTTVAFFAIVERVTHINVFLRFGDVLPLQLLRDATEDWRAGGARSFGSAQHPIALSVMLCMLIPIVLYLAREASWPRNTVNRAIVHGAMLVVLLGGIGVAVSRTGVVVLATMFVVTLVLRPVIAAGLALATIPMVLLASFASPKTVSETLLSFLDLDTLVASQYTSPGWAGQGRLADLGPAFQLVQQHPVFGTGYGGRIVVGEDANGFILDNQVLGILMDSGVAGVIGLAIFVLVPFVLLVRHSLDRRVPERYRTLAFAIAVSTAGYAAAMFFYDAFGFMQTLLVLCVLWAVGAWLLTEAPRVVTAPAVKVRT